MNERISIDPDVCHGKPCIRGMRYPVEMILELLGSGMSKEEILDDYADLTIEDIHACLVFAASVMHVKSISRMAV